MEHEKLMSQINEGSTASVCLQWMGPIFDEVEKNIVANLKRVVRTGEYKETTLVGGVSSLIAIDDLKIKLQGLSRQGESARKRLEED